MRRDFFRFPLPAKKYASEHIFLRAVFTGQRPARRRQPVGGGAWGWLPPCYFFGLAGRAGYIIYGGGGLGGRRPPGPLGLDR